MVVQRINNATSAVEAFHFPHGDDILVFPIKAMPSLED